MKINGSKPGEINYTPPYSTGLLKPPHAKRFGITVSLFMALEDKVTDGEGTNGSVLSGKPVTDEEFAKHFGVHPKSIAATRRKLELWGYIQTKRAKGGAYTVVVKKSKKWELLKRLRKNESAPVGSESAPTRSEYALGEDLSPINDKVVTRQRHSLVTEELGQFWNQDRGCLPEIKKFTETRKEKLTTRLRENPNFLSDLKAAVAKANASSFIQSGSWKPSIDWFLKNDGNLVKVLEGQYDDKGGTRGTPNPRGSNSGAGKRPGPFIPAACRKSIPPAPNALRRPTGG